MQSIFLYLNLNPFHSPGTKYIKTLQKTKSPHQSPHHNTTSVQLALLTYSHYNHHHYYVLTTILLILGLFLFLSRSSCASRASSSVNFYSWEISENKRDSGLCPLVHHYNHFCKNEADKNKTIYSHFNSSHLFRGIKIHVNNYLTKNLMM
jgi:hypothetical protein